MRHSGLNPGLSLSVVLGENSSFSMSFQVDVVKTHGKNTGTSSAFEKNPPNTFVS